MKQRNIETIKFHLHNLFYLQFCLYRGKWRNIRHELGYCGRLYLEEKNPRKIIKKNFERNSASNEEKMSYSPQNAKLQILSFLKKETCGNPQILRNRVVIEHFEQFCGGDCANKTQMRLFVAKHKLWLGIQEQDYITYNTNLYINSEHMSHLP